MSRLSHYCLWNRKKDLAYYDPTVLYGLSPFLSCPTAWLADRRDTSWINFKHLIQQWWAVQIVQYLGHDGPKLLSQGWFTMQQKDWMQQKTTCTTKECKGLICVGTTPNFALRNQCFRDWSSLLASIMSTLMLRCLWKPSSMQCPEISLPFGMRGTRAPMQLDLKGHRCTLGPLSCGKPFDCMAQSKIRDAQSWDVCIYNIHPIYKIPLFEKMGLLSLPSQHPCHAVVNSCCIWGRRQHDGQRWVLSLEHFE